jgi:secondary thiamine-phosphate synthase enzyme
MIFQESLKIKTPGRGLSNITNAVNKFVSISQITTGLCHVFIHHTSASLIICENADDTVQSDLELFMSRLVPDGDRIFNHTAEGPDDMPAHVRTILTQSSLTSPVTRSTLDLGTWQGIFLWEHRHHAHDRKITISIQGE